MDLKRRSFNYFLGKGALNDIVIFLHIVVTRRIYCVAVWTDKEPQRCFGRWWVMCGWMVEEEWDNYAEPRNRECFVTFERKRDKLMRTGKLFEPPNTWRLRPPLDLPSRTNPDTVYVNTTLSSHHSNFKPLKMDLTEGSETSANINQTPGKHPKVDTVKLFAICAISSYTNYVWDATVRT
jgi:hypothetical protein